MIVQFTGLKNVVTVEVDHASASQNSLVKSVINAKTNTFLILPATVSTTIGLFVLSVISRCHFIACDCNPEGSKSPICNDNGVCDCLEGFIGSKCSLPQQSDNCDGTVPRQYKDLIRNLKSCGSCTEGIGCTSYDFNCMQSAIHFLEEEGNFLLCRTTSVLLNMNHFCHSNKWDHSSKQVGKITEAIWSASF